MTNEELIKIREEKKLSKSEFAKLLGITPMMEGRYESGKVAIPEKIEAALKAVSDTAVATEIEVKKTVRKTARKAKEAVEKIASSDEAVAAEIEVKKTAKRTARKAKETVEEALTSDEAVAAEIELKKTVRSAARKAKEALEDAASLIKDTAKTATKKTSPQIVIESLLGGTITPEEVISRIPVDCDVIYIKPEENKAYWVKGDEGGDIELW